MRKNLERKGKRKTEGGKRWSWKERKKKKKKRKEDARN